MRRLVSALAAGLLAVPLGLLAQAPASRSAPAPIAYPHTRTEAHVDVYHGTTVPDPYRWLEDDRSAETADWVKRQNEVTFAHLNQIPFREGLRKRLTEVYNYERLTAPYREGAYWFFRKNTGLQNQSVLYWQKGLTGKPEVLIDPNAWNAEGTTRLGGATASKSVKYLAYTKGVAGSDWQEIEVMELPSKRKLADRIQWVKFGGVSWRGDDGFYYSRYPEPKGESALSGQNRDNTIYYHKLGTPQSQDVLVYADPANPLRYNSAGLTEDERFLIRYQSEGTHGNAIYVKDLVRNTDWLPLWPRLGDEVSVVDNVGDKLLVLTNYNAPRYRLLLIDPANPAEANWQEVLPQRDLVLSDVGTAGGRLFATYTKDVLPQVEVYAIQAKTGQLTLERTVQLPGLGSVSGFGGKRDDKVVFYSFTSYNTPTSIYRYDLATGKSTLHQQPKVPFDPAQFEVQQVFFTSKDGTRIPMFLVAKKGLVRNGTNPTWLYGYGGFNIAQRPAFSTTIIPWLEQGGLYAVVNLRGGSEYGEDWHQQGIQDRKQNVFDDFIGAAEWLIANQYTSRDQLGISGRSNGGLLVGAVMTQRPDLMKVALPAVGVLDMLRFHKFTVGHGWISDYGSSDTPEGFRYLRAYSPLHNLQPGVHYPATLVTTADHDDRVVPAHSFKFAAALQVANGGPNPTLIRIETNSGHSASSTAKTIAIAADEIGFLMYHLGMQPQFGGQ